MGSLTFRRVWLPAAAVLVSLAQAASSAQPGQSDARNLVNPSRVVFQHDGNGVSGYALYLLPDGGSPIRIDLGALKADSKGLLAAPLPQVPAGVYRVEIAAYNASGESPRASAEPAAFTVTGPAASAAEPNHDTHAHAAPPPDPDPQKPSDDTKKKEGVGRRFWKVLVGDDDKP